VAALPLEKEPFISIVQKAGWVPRNDQEMVTMRKISTSAENHNPVVRPIT
jgi:hypothetical protein